MLGDEVCGAGQLGEAGRSVAALGEGDPATARALDQTDDRLDVLPPGAVSP